MNNLTNKHYLSLAAVMLLAHAVPVSIANSEIVLDDAEKQFVDSYIQMGKILVYLLLASGVIWAAHLQFTYDRIAYISTTINSLVIAGIILGIFAVVNDTVIFHDKRIDMQALKILFKSHLLPGKK